MSDSGNAVSGFATAMDGLASELGKLGHDVYYLGWQYYGQPERFIDHPHYTNLPNFGGHPFGAEALPYHLMHVRPDVLLALGDFFMTAYVVNMQRAISFCHWFPIDAVGVPDEIVTALRFTDLKVCFSKFGKEQCDKAGIANVKYIPHGVDSNIYKPLPPEQRAKTRQAFADFYQIKDIDKKFIVGCVNRNQRRKMFDRWIKTLAKVCEKDPDIIGWLHCDYKEPRESDGWNIPYLVRRYGLQGKILQTPGYVNFMVGITKERMNEVYNAFDIHYSATSGEGFGLTTVESQAAGVPNVITDYTTSREMVEGHGELIKPEHIITIGAGCDRALINIDEAADAILKLKNDAELRQKYSHDAREHMIKEYNWPDIGKQFSDFLTGALA